MVMDSGGSRGSGIRTPRVKRPRYHASVHGTSVRYQSLRGQSVSTVFICHWPCLYRGGDGEMAPAYMIIMFRRLDVFESRWKQSLTPSSAPRGMCPRKTPGTLSLVHNNNHISTRSIKSSPHDYVRSAKTPGASLCSRSPLHPWSAFRSHGAPHSSIRRVGNRCGRCRGLGKCLPATWFRTCFHCRTE